MDPFLAQKCEAESNNLFKFMAELIFSKKIPSLQKNLK